MQTSDLTQGKVSTILTTQAIPMIWGIFTQNTQVALSVKSYLMLVPITCSFLGIVMLQLRLRLKVLHCHIVCFLDFCFRFEL